MKRKRIINSKTSNMFDQQWQQGSKSHNTDQQAE
jgi:hypothetical protein